MEPGTLKSLRRNLRGVASQCGGVDHMVTLSITIKDPNGVRNDVNVVPRTWLNELKQLANAVQLGRLHFLRNKFIILKMFVYEH